MFKRLLLLAALIPGTALGMDIEYDITWVSPTESEDGSPLTDLAGFKVYWKTDEEAVYTEHEIIEDKHATQYTLGLTVDGSTKVFLAMTAYDLEGNESVFSNELSSFFLQSPDLDPGPVQIQSVTPRVVDCPTGMTCVVTPMTQ